MQVQCYKLCFNFKKIDLKVTIDDNVSWLPLL